MPDILQVELFLALKSLQFAHTSSIGFNSQCLTGRHRTTWPSSSARTSVLYTGLGFLALMIFNKSINILVAENGKDLSFNQLIMVCFLLFDVGATVCSILTRW